MALIGQAEPSILCNYLKPLSFNRSILHSSSTKTGLVCVLGLKGCSLYNRFFNCLLQNTWKFFPLKQKSVPFVQQLLLLVGVQGSMTSAFCHQVSKKVFEPNLALTYVLTKISVIHCSKCLCLAQVTELMLLTHHHKALGNVPGDTFSPDSRRSHFLCPR